MTTPTPAQPVPPVDLGNPYLQALLALPGHTLDAGSATTLVDVLGAAMLTTARLDTPAGPRLVVTLRVAGATVTALLSAAGDARTWGEQLAGDGTRFLSGLHLPGQNGHQQPGGRG